MNTNIKLYEDGDRLILVFENASIGIKEMIQNLLAPAVAVPDLVPSHIKAEAAPDLEGKNLINEKTTGQTKEISRFTAGKLPAFVKFPKPIDKFNISHINL